MLNQQKYFKKLFIFFFYFSFSTYLYAESYYPINGEYNIEINAKNSINSSDMFPISLELKISGGNKIKGNVNYPTYNCSGELYLPKIENKNLIIKEKILKNRDICDPGFFEFKIDDLSGLKFAGSKYFLHSDIYNLKIEKLNKKEAKSNDCIIFNNKLLKSNFDLDNSEVPYNIKNNIDFCNKFTLKEYKNEQFHHKYANIIYHINKEIKEDLINQIYKFIKSTKHEEIKIALNAAKKYEKKFPSDENQKFVRYAKLYLNGFSCYKDFTSGERLFYDAPAFAISSLNALILEYKDDDELNLIPNAKYYLKEAIKAKEAGERGMESLKKAFAGALYNMGVGRNDKLSKCYSDDLSDNFSSYCVAVTSNNPSRCESISNDKKLYTLCRAISNNDSTTCHSVDLDDDFRKYCLATIHNDSSRCESIDRNDNFQYFCRASAENNSGICSSIRNDRELKKLCGAVSEK